MKGKLILLVEDNPDDEIMTIRSLRDGGFEGDIAVVRDGQEAMDWLFCEGEHEERPGVMPQVVLLDIRLPKRSGFQVLQALRTDPRTKNIPTVMLTASTEQEDIVHSYDLHANSYIRKPVSFADFRKVMQSLGVYWTEYNHVPTN